MAFECISGPTRVAEGWKDIGYQSSFALPPSQGATISARRRTLERSHVLNLVCAIGEKIWILDRRSARDGNLAQSLVARLLHRLVRPLEHFFGNGSARWRLLPICSDGVSRLEGVDQISKPSLGCFHGRASVRDGSEFVFDTVVNDAHGGIYTGWQRRPRTGPVGQPLQTPALKELAY
jgi:hypothetical protein